MCIQEKYLDSHERGPQRAQTDAAALDIILTLRQGVVVPVVIEVNDHDCLAHAGRLEFIMAQQAGESVRVWVSTMVARSQMYLLHDKRILVVGGGGCSKEYLWPAARDYGIKVILVDQDPEHIAKNQVEWFVHVEGMGNHADDSQNARNIIAALTKQDFLVCHIIYFLLWFIESVLIWLCSPGTLMVL